MLEDSLSSPCFPYLNISVFDFSVELSFFNLHNLLSCPWFEELHHKHYTSELKLSAGKKLAVVLVGPSSYKAIYTSHKPQRV